MNFFSTNFKKKEMKKQNSKLFAKFEDAKILNETAVKLNGGGGSLSIEENPSVATGDHDCTQDGADCTDINNFPNTKEYQDSIFTSPQRTDC